MPETTTSTKATYFWRAAAVILGILAVVTKHYPMQKSVHVGMYAGSLLQRSDWDH